MANYPLFGRVRDPGRLQLQCRAPQSCAYIELQAQPHLVTINLASCFTHNRQRAGPQTAEHRHPTGFRDANGGVVVENHLNIIYADNHREVSPDAISPFLTRRRQTRRSVVSAWQRRSVNLQTGSSANATIAQAKAIERLLLKGATKATIEAKIASFYTGTGE